MRRLVPGQRLLASSGSARAEYCLRALNEKADTIITCGSALAARTEMVTNRIQYNFQSLGAEDVGGPQMLSLPGTETL